MKDVIRQQILEFVKACKKFEKSGYTLSSNYRRPTEYRSNVLHSFNNQLTIAQLKTVLKDITSSFENDQNIYFSIDSNEDFCPSEQAVLIHAEHIIKHDDISWHKQLVKMLSDTNNSGVPFSSYISDLDGEMKSKFQYLLSSLAKINYDLKIKNINNDVVKCNTIYMGLMYKYMLHNMTVYHKLYKNDYEKYFSSLDNRQVNILTVFNDGV